MVTWITAVAQAPSYFSFATEIPLAILTLLIYIYQKYFMKLFVAGLPYDLDDAELEEIFEKFGTVSSARVAMDRETGKSKGFAFVEMLNDAEGKAAIENLKDISLGKKPLVVTQAKESPGPKTSKSNGSWR